MTGPAFEPPPRFRLLQPLRRRDFALLALGQTVSLVGDGFHYVALSWQVYAISNVPTALSIVGVALTLPMVLLFLVGGVASDRFDRRRVMIGADLLRAGAIGLVGVLSVAGVLDLWHIIVLIAFYGAGQAFFYPASTAIVPDLVPDEELPQANAFRGVMRPLMLRLVGPALGGLLVGAAGPGPAFLVDGGTFLVSAAAIAAMTARPVVVAAPWRQSVREVREGFSFVRGQPWLWVTLVAAAVALLFFHGPVNVLLPFRVKNDLEAGAEGLGLIFAAGGAGSILASLAVGQMGLPGRRVTAMYLAWTVGVAGLAGFGLMDALWQGLAIGFVINALFAFGQIGWDTLLQQLVPRGLLGRVASVDLLVSFGLIPVSYALTGPVSVVLGTQTTMAGGALLAAVATIALLFVPGVRDPESRPWDLKPFEKGDPSLADE